MGRRGEAGERERGGKAGGGSERPVGGRGGGEGREKKRPWEGRGAADNVNLASTCERSYGGGVGGGGVPAGAGGGPAGATEAGRLGSEGPGTGGDERKAPPW